MKHFTKLSIFAAALFFIFTFQGCQKEQMDEDGLPAEEKRTHTYAASVAQDWADLILYLVKSEAKTPPHASRIYGYMGITLYESCVPGMPRNRSLQGQVKGLSGLPNRNNKKSYDFREVTNEAMYIVMKSLFTNMKPQNVAKMDSLHAAIASNIQGSINKAVYNNSNAFGVAMGNALVQWIGGDNYTQTRLMTYTVPSRATNPSFWAPTGPALNPLEPYWGLMRTTCMVNANACFIPSNLPYSTDPSSGFYQQAAEVNTVTQNLTQSQKDIALWWADNAGATYTPPGHWMAITSQMVDDLNYDLAEAAEVYALVGMAATDAFISCWEAKYRVNLLRPVTYIKENINPNFVSFISTPAFPEYTSGHSVCSGAMSEVLTQYVGTKTFTDETNIDLGFAPRTFSSFYEAADEAAISRLYGGIHFREAIDNGVAQGRLVGQIVMGRIKLKKHD